MKIDYIVHAGAMFFDEYTPLRPTGRWRLETSPKYDHWGYEDGCAIFIEHQGRFFRRWVPEWDIRTLEVKTTATFKCHY